MITVMENENMAESSEDVISLMQTLDGSHRLHVVVD